MKPIVVATPYPVSFQELLEASVKTKPPARKREDVKPEPTRQATQPIHKKE